MLLREFYEHTLPPTGNYTLFRTSIKEHFWAEDLDELVALTQTLSEFPDVYFATGTFVNQDSRTQANCDQKKAFYFDLDAGEAKLAKHGPEKVYANRDEAIADIVAFARKQSFLPTMIVASGEGLHIYWELDAPIPAAQWTAIAKKLQKFGASSGLKIDSAVTADSARILRPIGTLHHNGKTVEVLKFTGKVYTAQEIADKVGVEPLDMVEPKYDLGINDDIPEVVGPPKAIKKVLINCAAAQHAALNQDKIEEPYWRLMIGIAKHTVEGADAAHALSRKHPKYNKQQTQDYFERWATGPSTCEKFAEFNAKACGACPHKGKIKSPIQLGALNVEEVEKLPEDKKPAAAPAPKATGKPWDGQIPQGFDVVTHKGRQTLVHYFDTERENEVGEMVPIRVTVPISHEIFWLGNWADPMNPTDTAQATLFSVQYNGRIDHCVMNQEIVASNSEVAKFLASKGIHTTTDKRALTSMNTYLKEQLQRIKVAERKPKIRDRFGLTYLPTGELVAAQGEYVISADGTIVKAMVSPALQTMAHNYHIPLPESKDGAWDVSVWKSHIKPAAQQFIDFMKTHYAHEGLAQYRLAFMLSAASPLMCFNEHGYIKGVDLPGSSFTVSLFSKDGGKGKTTLMQLMTMVYGISGKSQDRNTVSSTTLARTGTLSFGGGHPSFMDEMGGTDAKVMAETINQIANGGTRIRLDRSGGIKEQPRWALMNTCATNLSIRDMVAHAKAESDAIQYRMVELDVSKIYEHPEEMRARFERDMASIVPCAGALGAIIHLQICRKANKGMLELFAEAKSQARKVLGSKQVDRFQDRAIAAMIVMDKLLKEAGLELFDIAEMCETYRVAAVSAEEFITENTTSRDPLELLSNMLFDLQAFTTITANETRRTGSVGNHDVALNHNGRVPDKLKVRHVTTSGISYVSADAIREWCTEKKTRQLDIIGAAKQQGVLRHVYPSDMAIGKSGATKWASNFNLAKGMKESTGGQVRCYAFHVPTLCRVLGQDYNGTVLRVISGGDAEVVEDAAVNE